MEETEQLLPAGLSQIIAGCIHKDRSAQARLYNLYSGKMMGVCMWYAKNKEEAEEILQDGFVRVFTYIHTYTGEGSFEGWIRKIMVNAALQKFRCKKGNHLYAAVEYQPEIHDNEDLSAALCRYDEKELLKLIQTLPPVYRMVFSLYVVEGLKHKEIAMLLSISEGTSKSNLSDARAIMQRKVYELQKTAS